MPRSERLFVYACLAVAIALGAGLRLPAAGAAGGRIRDDRPVKIATCDVTAVADKLMASDRYQPGMAEEQERIKKALEPMQAELQGMADRLKNADPKDPEAQKTYAEFQQKQREYQQAAAKENEAYQQFVGRKYVEAYEAAKASIDAVAESLGYTHVLATKKPDAKIEVSSIPRVIESVLARPVLRAPEGTDITEDVIKELKLG